MSESLTMRSSEGCERGARTYRERERERGEGGREGGRELVGVNKRMFLFSQERASLQSGWMVRDSCEAPGATRIG
jgi:hypothetical protein